MLRLEDWLETSARTHIDEGGCRGLDEYQPAASRTMQDPALTGDRSSPLGEATIKGFR